MLLPLNCWDVIMKHLLLLLLLLCATEFVQSQTMPDSKGKDFWFCYLPNFHNGGIDDPQVQIRDSLYVFVVAEKPTNITLTYSNFNGNTRTRTYSITDPTKVLSIGMPFYSLELVGFNLSGSVDITGGQNKQVANQSFHLVSEEDVTVYALNQAETTSDAFLVLPKDALRNDYFVMSYNADLLDDAGANTPSQYAIVATEDSTIVELKNTKATYNNNNGIIKLQKGDVWLVQSLTQNVGDDLTGSHITSNKPIAVFSGHQRVRVPLSARNNTSSRDCLIEQLPPKSTWGRSALLVPYSQPPGVTEFGEDRYRVIAGYDSTRVYIDSVQVTTLQSGQFYEADLTTAHLLTTNRPVMVAQFKKTSTPQDRNGQGNQLGDPFMMMIPPAEQFLKSYRFINAQAFQDSTLDRFGSSKIVSVYKLQYVTVVVPTTSIRSLLLDNQPQSASLFRAIPKSQYSYATIPLNDGVHTIEADTGIGIYVYGYGYANSYGYIGGMSFIQYDFNYPKIFSQRFCYNTIGTVYDTSVADSKLVRVISMPDSLKNVVVDIEKFTPPIDSVHYSVALIDDQEDGSFAIEAEDAYDYIARKRFDVPGFTVRFLDANNSPNRLPFSVNFRGADKHTRCKTVNLVNTGKFPQEILDARIRGNNFDVTINVKVPTTINPGDTLPITICARFDNEGDYVDSLYIKTPCQFRLGAVINSTIRHDNFIPVVTATNTECNEGKNITFDETGDFQSGIERVVISDTTNCTVLVQSRDSLAKVNILINDWRLDSWYKIEVRDSVGNKITLQDTIEGFTLMYKNLDSALPKIQYNNVPYKKLACDTIELYNYGIRTKSFNTLAPHAAVYFTFPQEQFPITLPPNTSKRLAVCFEPHGDPDDIDNIWRDTLYLRHNCRVRPLVLKGLKAPTILNGTNFCDVPVKLESIVSSNNVEVKLIAPNPTSGTTTIEFYIPQQSQTSVYITDELGGTTELLSGQFTRGTYSVEANLHEFRSGVYSCTVVTPTSRSTKQLIIIR